MGFELMHRDVHVADVDISEVDGDMFRLREVHSLDHMPVGTLRDGKGDVLNLGRWWARRTIPESRSRLRRLLERVGLPDARSLLLGSHGLSLSDQYWVRPSGSDILWEEVNFFDNEFSESVGMTLLGKEAAEGFVDLMSPDNTSEGNLVKMWRIVDGVRCLFKGGSVPFRQEPYNEVVATMIMDRLGIDNAGYSLGWIDGDPYSVCLDFVDRDTELVTMAYVMYASRWCGTAYRTCVSACSEMGIDVVPFLDRMIVTDFLLANEDRHLYNLGLIRTQVPLNLSDPHRYTTVDPVLVTIRTFLTWSERLERYASRSRNRSRRSWTWLRISGGWTQTAWMGPYKTSVRSCRNAKASIRNGRMRCQA